MNKLKKTAAFLAGAAVLLQASSALPFQAMAASSDPVKCVYADSSGEIISGAVYNISSYLSEKYLTAQNDGSVQQWEASANSTQDWKIINTGGGYCKIVRSDDPSIALTVENGNSTNGNKMTLSAYAGQKSQHFMLHKTGSVYWITAECSGNAALDVYGQSSENGAVIDQWDYWGGANQKFYITPAGGRFTLSAADLNGDGKTDLADMILMKSGLLEGFDGGAGLVSDLNYDGFNDSNDLITLNNYFLNRDQKPGTEYTSFKRSSEETAYLFAYFSGNDPSQERLSYAVSTDGYNFKALNGGKPVWNSTVGTGCIRDPYIFQGKDGYYYLLATDMKSSLGWSSNRNLISARSRDLINWTDVTLIEIANKYPSMMGSDRAWAPQAIWDDEKQSYMIYWANHSNETGSRTIMYYAYSSDMKTFDTQPSLLFAPASGDSAIDSDIIYQKGQYYMYYKNETNKRIYLAVSDHASGPYREIKQISPGTLGVEGPNIYNIAGTDHWLLMSDAYGDGYYVMQETSDLENFTTVSRNDYSFDFTPRHGYVIPISQSQYNSLTTAFSSESLKPHSTGTDSINISVSKGETPVLPGTVSVDYSDGSSSEFPVKWNQDQLKSADTSVSGVYAVTGKLEAPASDDTFIAERADPFVTDGGDGYYYFTASYPAYGSVDKGYDRIVLRRSNTVSGLAQAEEKTIWKAHSSGILAKHIWAPEMHKIGGAWYMFFAAGSSSDIWAIRPYVLKCSGDPYTGQWTELGQMQASSGDTSSFTSFSLDMTYFENNGKHYVIWAEIKGDSSLFMAQIDPSAPNRLISKPILLTKPEFSWEKVNHNVNEGAAVLKTDSKIYVFFSASGTGSEYCVGRMEADINSDLMNISNWKKITSPVMTTADVKDAAGPGHNSFVTDENGSLLIVYHARPASHSSKDCGTYATDPLYDPCRHARLRRVFFDRNGVPLISMDPQSLLAQKDRTVTAFITVK